MCWSRTRSELIIAQLQYNYYISVHGILWMLNVLKLNLSLGPYPGRDLVHVYDNSSVSRIQSSKWPKRLTILKYKIEKKIKQGMAPWILKNNGSYNIL